jgi:hypothetical protein
MSRNTFRENIKNIYNYDRFTDNNILDDQLRNEEFTKFEITNEKTF